MSHNKKVVAPIERNKSKTPWELVLSQSTVQEAIIPHLNRKDCASLAQIHLFTESARPWSLPIVDVAREYMVDVLQAYKLGLRFCYYQEFSDAFIQLAIENNHFAASLLYGPMISSSTAIIASMEAAKAGSVEFVSWIIVKLQRPNPGTEIAEIAARHGQDEVAVYLMRHCEINRERVLHAAGAHGCVRAFKRIYSSISRRERREMHNRLLILLVVENSVDILSFLRHRGTPVTVQAMRMAACLGRLKIIDLFLLDDPPGIDIAMDNAIRGQNYTILSKLAMKCSYIPSSALRRVAHTNDAVAASLMLSMIQPVFIDRYYQIAIRQRNFEVAYEFFSHGKFQSPPSITERKLVRAFVAWRAIRARIARQSR